MERDTIDFTNLMENNSEIGTDMFSLMEEQVQQGVESGEIEKIDKTGTEDEFPEETEEIKEKQDNPGKDEKDEEELEKEPKVTTKAPPSTKNIKSSSNVHSLVFQSLVEEEVLSEFSKEDFEKRVEEVGTAEAVKEVFAKEATIARQSVIEELEDDAKEYVRLKDLGLDTATATSLIASKIQYDSIKEEDLLGEDKEDLRKKIIAQDLYNSTNFSEEKIKKEVERIVKSGEDIEESKQSLKNVKEFTKEQIKQAEKAKVEEAKVKEEQKKQIVAKYTEFIDKLEEPIPGVKINKQTKDALKKDVLSGNMWSLRQKDPIKFDTMVAYAIKNGLLDGKFDKPLAKAKTKATEELENILKTTPRKGGNPVMDTEDDESGKGTLDSLFGTINTRR